MCAKFGCGPTVVSKKREGVQTDRETKKTAALYSRKPFAGGNQFASALKMWFRLITFKMIDNIAY